MSPLLPPGNEQLPPLDGSIVSQEAQDVKNFLNLDNRSGSSGSTVEPLSSLHEVPSITKLLPFFSNLPQETGGSSFSMVPSTAPAGVDVIKEFLKSSAPSGGHMTSTTGDHMISQSMPEPPPNQMAASTPPATTHNYSASIPSGSSSLTNISANQGQSIKPTQTALPPLGSSDIGHAYSSQTQRHVKLEAPTSTSTDEIPSAIFLKNPIHVLPPCKVCGQKGTGFHYGVNTCEPCKVTLFFLLFL